MHRLACETAFPEWFGWERLSVGGMTRRRDRVASAQLLRFEPGHFQQVRQRGVIFRRRHLRQLRGYCGNIVGDVMFGTTALISHDFAPSKTVSASRHKHGASPGSWEANRIS
jgi:hypothetical protein